MRVSSTALFILTITAAAIVNALQNPHAPRNLRNLADKSKAHSSRPQGLPKIHIPGDGQYFSGFRGGDAELRAENPKISHKKFSSQHKST